MPVPAQLRYSPEHEWIALDASPVTIGITDYAAGALGDIVYVQLPAVGDRLAAGDVCGELESTKSVSELYSPVTGEVMAVNSAVVDDPALVGQDPYGAGWLFAVVLDEAGDAAPTLLSAQEYADLIDGA